MGASEAGMDPLRAEAYALLAPFAGAEDPDRLADQAMKLRPRRSDYRRAFAGPSAERARYVYEPMWRSGPVDVPKPDDEHAELRLCLATPEMIRLGLPDADGFPEPYATIVDHLQPERVWAAWRWIRPDGRDGHVYDGLVRLDDRWAWFPSPWRHLLTP